MNQAARRMPVTVRRTPLSVSTFLLATSPTLDQVVLSLDHAVTIRTMAGKVQQWLSVVDGQVRFSSWHDGWQGPGPLLDQTPETSYGFIPDGPLLRVYVDAEKPAAAALAGNTAGT